MDFKDIIRQLIERVEKLQNSIQTEEATKNALIMPFLAALGYDVFNPLEVVPEYTCDIGTKKGEKIDYAIIRDGEPALLIECKHCIENLNLHNNQLLRYFNVSKAKFGLLTNGIIYRFYTDLEKENVMDDKPFLEINLLDIKDNQIEELRKFHKSYFDVDNIMNTASELKYTNELKGVISSEFAAPTVEFVKLLARQVYGGPMTAKTIEQFTGLVRRAAAQWKNDAINERFKAALNSETEIVQNESGIEEPVKECDENRIVTSEEEMQAFYIVKSILAQKAPLSRIFARDTQSYFGVLLDDNNRKPICRFHFNGGKKYIEIFDADKKGTKHLLESIEDIYKFSDPILSIIDCYELSK